ncbi:MAG: isoprenylcysteine carboxylmethyltransferase family protein [Usitatibacter sp.]
MPTFLERGGGWLAAQGPLTIATVLLPPWLGRLAEGAVRLAAIALIVAGIAFFVWARRMLGKSFTPFPQPVDDGVLTTSGAYGLARHPIYTSLIVFAAGWAILWQSIAGAVCAVILFAFFDLKSRREETWLERKYQDYPAYRARVKRFIPGIY